MKDVALTHLHYDHCGNLGRFPAARFHLQESEIHYATGRYMAYPKLSHSYEVEDVCDIVRLNYRRRIKFYNGDAELASGIELYAASLRLAWRRRCRPRRPRAAGAQWTATCGSWRADAAPSWGRRGLRQSLGVEENSPEVEQAFQTILRACLAHNVACGITATTAQGIARRLGEGWKMIRTTNGALNQWRASQSGR